VNPAVDAKDTFGLPSFASSYVTAGHKNLLALTGTETLGGRLELGYGYDRFDTGTLDGDILKATGVDVDHKHVALQSYNARVLIIKENDYGTNWLPAITAGVQYKKNSGIEEIDNKLGGALTSIGLDSSDGEDYFVTATKAFVADWTFGHPLIVSAGARNSSAAQLGFLGFSDHRTTTFEGNVVYIPTSWLLVAYEYRQKGDPYRRIGKLVGPEDDWQAVDVSWLINSHATLVAGWGIFGNVVNTKEDGAWFLQLKYEL
jgi:hypothetical protein